MIIGSRAFFEGLEGFTSKDIDILELVDNPTGFKDVRQFKFSNKCVFQWRKMPADELISVTLQRGFPMEVGKFLVPEFCDTLGMEIEDLFLLEPLIEKLDDLHKYEEIIYESYITNGGFYLTDSQLEKAYTEYRKNR